MSEEPCNSLSHMCGYCNKIFTNELDLDKHIEEFHFLEVLNEVDEEDDVVDSANVDSYFIEPIDINVKTVSEAAEKDSPDTNNVKVKKENCPQTNKVDRDVKLKSMKLSKLKEANKQNTNNSHGNVDSKSNNSVKVEFTIKEVLTQSEVTQNKIGVEKVKSKQKSKTQPCNVFSMEEKIEAVYLAKQMGVIEASNKLNLATKTLENWIKLVTDPLYCTQCAYTTYKSSSMVQHEKKGHRSEKKLSQSLASTRGFHLPNYQLRPLPCELCPFRYTKKRSLIKHKRIVHEKVDLRDHGRYKIVKEHACSSCPKSYSSKYKLTEHMLVCSGSSSILTNHDPALVTEVANFALSSSVLVAARTYKVDKATVTFWVKGLTDTEQQNCHMCGKDSRNKRALKQHVRRYHTDPEGRLIEQSIADKESGVFSKVVSKVKPVQFEGYHFVCEFCCKAFQTQLGLDRHSTSHMSPEEREEVRPKLAETTAKTGLGLKELYEAKYGKLEKNDIPASGGLGVQANEETKNIIQKGLKEEF